jgi:RNA polymerase sigma factor (TIGR02999 family)
LFKATSSQIVRTVRLYLVAIHGPDTMRPMSHSSSHYSAPGSVPDPPNQDTSRAQITQVLEAIQRGERKASEQLLPLVYDQLRAVAESQLARRGSGHTLQPTALVHEAWLSIAGKSDPGWDSRAHFFGAAARAMRHILVDRARHHRVRRQAHLEMEQGALQAVESPPDQDVLAIHEALERMEQKHPGMAKVVTLRFFAGLSMSEVAETAGVPKRTVERWWKLAQSWLRREVRGPDEG